MQFDYDQGDIHRTYAAGRVLNPAQRAVWSAVIREEAGARSVRCALDLGCGVGRMTPIVREALGAPVIGIDLSARMLAAAVADPATRGARWIQASANAIPLRGESVDLIGMFLVFHHLADRLTVLRECARVLAEGAGLIIVNSTLETLDGQTWLSSHSVVHINALRVRSRTTGRLSSDSRSRGVGSPANMPSMTARAALYASCAASFWPRCA
jgi:ubiquinone/menaquinone biosynthesis C-methylase UbiE